MENFNFKYWMTKEEFPSMPTTRFGRGYTFTAKPNGPDEVTFHLSFKKGLFYIADPVTRAIDTASVPEANILVLRAFYARNGMYSPFNFPHPYLGNVVVRFAKPLAMPDVDTQNPGAYGGLQGYIAFPTEPFQLDLLLVP